MSRAVFRNDGTPPVFIRERYLQIRKTEGAADLKALAFFCLILYGLNVVSCNKQEDAGVPARS